MSNNTIPYTVVFPKPAKKDNLVSSKHFQTVHFMKRGSPFSYTESISVFVCNRKGLSRNAWNRAQDLYHFKQKTIFRELPVF